MFVRWTTHEPQGLSEKDVRMARVCDGIAKEEGVLEDEKVESVVEGVEEEGGLECLTDGLAREAGDCCVPKKNK